MSRGAQYALAALVIAAALGALFWYERPPPEAPAAPPPVTTSIAVKVDGLQSEGLTLVEALARDVPGVVHARLDYVSETLHLDIAPRVFRRAQLAEALARPGVGWRVTR